MHFVLFVAPDGVHLRGWRHPAAAPADGFAIMPATMPTCTDRFLSDVAPIQQERGSFRTDYARDTLREHLGLETPRSRNALQHQLAEAGVYHAQPTRAQSCPAHIYETLARQAVAGGGLIGGLRVEPELGTPVRGGLPKTVARRTAEGWTISGQKIYSTGSTGLSWFAVWAKTDEPEPRVAHSSSPRTAPASPSFRPGIISACARRSATRCCSTRRRRPPTIRSTSQPG